MINKTEAEEKLHLEKVRQQLAEALAEYEDRLRRSDKVIRKEKAYIGDNRTSMDGAEKASVRQAVNQSILSAEVTQDFARKIRKLLSTPYFGRFDFVMQGESCPLPVYVGIHTFVDREQDTSLIYDWRAPISTVFYDYELGEAAYESPDGKVAGEVTLKRQFRIRDGRMQFMLESGLNIQDDILQEELSRTSDDKMKNIVATIQRDQNAIIRNEHAQVLIIQGVAGSGKTSIALHRIAFLLYRFKEDLTSKDILIISPNKVFGDYISNVLPELGEEQVGETEMEELADELLDHKVRFQSFFEQTALLVETNDTGLRERIREKSTVAFLQKLNKYVEYLDDTRIDASDIHVGRRAVAAEIIESEFRKFRGLPVAEMLRQVAQAVENYLWREYNHEVSGKERNSINASLKKMYRQPNLLKSYKEFFVWLEKPKLFKMAKHSMLEYSDVFPLIYLKMRLEGRKHVGPEPKHLLIDEMQDYTAVQYAVIQQLFPCKKTILGDANQAVNPFSSSTAEDIYDIFREAESVRLCKSYRSSYEITQFAQKISPNAELVAIERHGNPPSVLSFKSRTEEIAHIRQLIESAPNRGYRTTGIICKTQKQAEHLFKSIGKECGAHLLNARSSSFKQGVVICTAHLAKGLEFDQVIVPHVSSEHYITMMDRNLLYVACTRAMHDLTLTYVGMPTFFIPMQ